jgi:hypothetical protein
MEEHLLLVHFGASLSKETVELDAKALPDQGRLDISDREF